MTLEIHRTGLELGCATLQGERASLELHRRSLGLQRTRLEDRRMAPSLRCRTL